MRAELKANYLLRNGGPIRNLKLGSGARRTIFRDFRAHMRVMKDLPARAFSVVVDKRTKPGKPAEEIFDLAWEGLLQRLERTSTKEQETFMIMHDEGDNENIRKWVRRARRYLTAGSGVRSARSASRSPSASGATVVHASRRSSGSQARCTRALPSSGGAGSAMPCRTPRRMSRRERVRAATGHRPQHRGWGAGTRASLPVAAATSGRVSGLRGEAQHDHATDVGHQGPRDHSEAAALPGSACPWGCGRLHGHLRRCELPGTDRVATPPRSQPVPARPLG